MYTVESTQPEPKNYENFGCPSYFSKSFCGKQLHFVVDAACMLSLFSDVSTFRTNQSHSATKNQPCTVRYLAEQK